MGRTPLHAAAFTDHVECLQLLLSHNAHVNSVDSSGKTPLMMAAENGQTNTVGKEAAWGLCCSECECCLCTIQLPSDSGSLNFPFITSPFLRFETFYLPTLVFSFRPTVFSLALMLAGSVRMVKKPDSGVRLNVSPGSTNWVASCLSVSIRTVTKITVPTS